MSSQQRLRATTVSRRSSRRIRGLRPLPSSQCSSSLYLPIEVKAVILEFLEKEYLKRVRLLSKEWCSLATQFLFDTIYISPREKDVEVFERITRHPVLSHAVTKLVYDTSRFKQGLGAAEYFRMLSEDFSPVALFWEKEIFNSSNAEINKYIEDTKRSWAKAMTSAELREKHIQDSFIVEGYRVYRDHATYEQESLRSGMFFTDLCSGLHRLANLHSVAFNNQLWNDWHELSPEDIDSPILRRKVSGSPLVRNWKPFHLHPVGHSCIDEEPSLLAYHFNVVVQAISVTQRRITSFRLPTGYKELGVPYQALTTSKLPDAQMQYTLHGLSHVEDFAFQISTKSEDVTNSREPLHLVQRLLAHTVGLKKLSLSLLDDCGDVSGLHFQYADVFPTVGFWPNLKELDLTGLTMSGLNLFTVVRGLTKVRMLTLRAIELTKGSWEGVFVGLYIAGLERLVLGLDLTHLGGTVFWPGERYPSLSCPKMIDAVKEYVIYGGRHPCLPPDGDFKAPFSWYLELFTDESLKELTVFAREHNMELPPSYRR